MPVVDNVYFKWVSYKKAGKKDRYEAKQSKPHHNRALILAEAQCKTGHGGSLAEGWAQLNSVST